MERTAGFLQKYPPGFAGMLAATTILIALLAGILLTGTRHPLLAIAFIAVIAVTGGFGAYRQSKFLRAGLGKAPPVIKSTPLATVITAVEFAVYFLVFGLLVRQPDESYGMTMRMTIFGFLMGAAMTYRRRRWPDAPIRYEALAAAIVVLSSVLIWLVLRVLFGL